MLLLSRLRNEYQRKSDEPESGSSLLSFIIDKRLQFIANKPLLNSFPI
jgi:hypothetical protein